jgi:hypothetical protein
MAKPKAPKPSSTVVEFRPPVDAADINAMFDNTAQGDEIAGNQLLHVPLGRPAKNKWIRVLSDPAYRRSGHIYVLKVESGGEVSEETPYIVTKEMVPHMEGEAQPCLFVTYVDRAGNPGIWPLKRPKDGKDYIAWSTARAAAKLFVDRWGRLIWVNGAYKPRFAKATWGDPDISKLPSFEELIAIAAGKDKIIRTKEHPVFLNEIEGADDADDADESDDGLDSDVVA